MRCLRNAPSLLVEDQSDQRLGQFLLLDDSTHPSTLWDIALYADDTQIFLSINPNESNQLDYKQLLEK